VEIINVPWVPFALGRRWKRESFKDKIRMLSEIFVIPVNCSIMWSGYHIYKTLFDGK
jgi:hypothetical protein